MHSTVPLGMNDLFRGSVDPGRVSEWMSGKRFPIVDGNRATFVYRGQAESVALRHWIYGLESSQPLQRVPNTDLWYLEMDIPAKSRVEYKFELRLHGHSQWIEDPLNPNRARDPFGVNSVLQGAGYEAPTWVQPDPNARAGELEPFSFPSKSFGGRRNGHIYYPARFRRTRQYPLLVVHDGNDYLRFTAMKTVLDNLIHHLDVADMIVVFADTNDRLREYANDERHAKYLCEELVPYLTRRLPIIDRPAGRCLMGASFGAVASLSTAWRYPGYWGRLFLQSGSFAFTDIGKGNRRGPAFDPVVDFMNQFRAAPSAVSERVFMSCGVYESLIYENRSLVPMLDATGMQVKLVESRDGHNWENWRDRLRDGLSWLLPGPLMMVYE